MGAIRLCGEPRWKGKPRLTTWYYAIGARGELHRLIAHRAEEIILWPDYGPATKAAVRRAGRSTDAVPVVAPRSPVPRAYQHAPGRVAIFAVVLILVRSIPIYVERGHLATIALEPRYAGPAPAVPWPWDRLAAQLIEDVSAPPVNRVNPLAAFLAGTSGGMLPDDVLRLVHDTSEEIRGLWLQVLLEGRQTRPVWDLRTGTVVTGGQPLNPDPPVDWGPVAKPPKEPG